MKLIYLGEELDSSIEHDLYSDTEFGFKVDIKYTNESWYPEKQATAHNCTQVHHLWSLNYMGGSSIAFESDIRKTGFTRRIDDIEVVIVELAEKMYDEY